MILKFYRKPALTLSKIEQNLLGAKEKLNINATEMQTEWCIYVEVSEPLDEKEMIDLKWLLRETYEPENFGKKSFLVQRETVIEIGPRLNFETAFSSRAVSICQSSRLAKVKRLEQSLRLGLQEKLTDDEEEIVLLLFCDRMTQIRYTKPLESFESDLSPAPVRVIDMLGQGRDALRAINKELGLSMDEQDIEMYNPLFVEKLGRNPTDVELFQLGQANSGHSRHHFFRGKLVIDKKPIIGSLMDVIKAPWKKKQGNSVLAFSGSAIRGHKVKNFVPTNPGRTGSFSLFMQVYHLALTAETHNYPSGVEPYRGAETGSGGRERDVRVGAGCGGLMGVGGAGYCTGNLHISGYNLPWEQDNWVNPENLASPLKILIEASNGASAYQNCIGEPLPYGFVRTFGMNLSDDYWAWFKPVMFTVGAGQIDARQIKKGFPEKGMLVVQIGGPGYRIGLGGAAASSMLQGQNDANLDFNAVQRGDAEMQQRTNRLYQDCVEMGGENPIVLTQDFGAGGDCNAIPELIDPVGAKINLRAIPSGDKSLSALEIWGNESQERYGLLIWPDKLSLINEICKREKIPYAVIGEITGDGRVVLYDENDKSTPVDLPLEKVLGEIPQKTFELERATRNLEPLKFPENLTMMGALNLILRLPSVGSKGYLVRKADRSVTGLIVQQQCVGPNQLPAADCAIMAQSLFSDAGVALSIGEQPIKGLISPGAMARLAIAEALLNMAGAKITKLEDVKYLANWMLAAKLPGEGVWLYEAACALRDISMKLGIAAIGGKDSLSMAAKAKNPTGTEQIVKGPAQLVVSAFAPMSDGILRVTPDFKGSGNAILFIDLAKGKNRLGGSALAQVFKQIGNECPDVEDVNLLKRAFKAIQLLVAKGLILSIHDRSDGGLITTLLEMGFSGNSGMCISMKGEDKVLEQFFSEEPGLVIECRKSAEAIHLLKSQNIPVKKIGIVEKNRDNLIRVKYNNVKVLNEPMTKLRKIWEATSTAIEMLQTNPACVEEESSAMAELIKPPPYKLTFTPKKTPMKILNAQHKPKVAVIREQGSNGDREMAAALQMAGFEPWDVTMTDLISSAANLIDFVGAVFVGGFTFGDVLDAAKGWAGVIRLNPILSEMFDRFYKRSDTFSLGVCNGCQLMPLIGWVPWQGISDEKRPRFIENTSGRFESRFPAVRINSSPAIMLKGMEGSILGAWSAHGQGRFHAPDQEIMETMSRLGLIAMQFVDMDGNSTKTYPFNPNGSPNGITAICSPDGRHLATMMHPERTFLLRQYPWLPEKWKNLEASPWLQMFQNGYEWCIKNRR